MVVRADVPRSPALAKDSDEGDLPLGYAPRRCGNLLEMDLGDGLIIYDRDRSLMHRLNPSAALVWRMCDGQSSVSELVRDIVKEVGSSPHDVNAWVGGLLREFSDLGLTEDASVK
jgi:coenzyme PQQ synthesis protein D (PqqD)